MAEMERHGSGSETAAAPGLQIEPLSRESNPATLAAARELLLEYGRFVAAQSGIATFCYGALEREAAALPDSYLNQGGGVLLAKAPGIANIDTVESSNENWIGFIAWRTLPAPELADAWEIKRLWVRPEARGMNAGRRLVEAVTDLAIAAGKFFLLLDTAPHAMDAAYRLYLDMGFAPCPAYNGQPAPAIACLRKNLRGDRTEEP